MPTPPKAKTTRKTKKIKKTVKEGVAEKLSHIERALADIREMVDMNCGEAVLRTARAAGAAAAEEVLTTLAPAVATQFNTPPASLDKLPTFATPKPIAKPANWWKDRPIDNNEAFEAAMEATDPELAKKPGPKLWNEFLRNYMAREEAKGRKITRLQAMSEAGPNYRAKYGISEKRVRKTAKAPKNLGGVQVAPVEVAAETLMNRGAVPVKKVKLQAPGNIVPITPGRQSPPVPLTVPSPEPTPAPGILNTLRTALSGSPITALSNNSSSNSSSNSSNSSSSNSSNNSSSNSSNNSSNSSSSNSSNSSSNNSSSNSSSNSSTPPLTSPTSNAEIRPNPNYYGYENLGIEENGTRKVKIDGEDYLMTNQNRGLFRPVNGSLEWVGYLEPGGQIRSTNAPE